ncbi:hypothetical protein [Telluribacter sp. SYSU D00476]|uniref:hypothetical protein n=1 Tax=Telluribacter sp. SYSU D00476 TaxID=2811430 RepID=UPI001FF5C90A|nr:hypothetical protein [Telluribacter sp. SYSU D00476]
MNNTNIKVGKNGLRNYGFKKVQKDKIIHHYDDYRYTENLIGLFYTKECQYCRKEYEGKRVDSTFCSPGCQKAHLRQRRRKAN